MKLSQLGGEAWTSKEDSSRDRISVNFTELTSSDNPFVHSVGDILSVTRSKQSRNYLGERTNFAHSSSEGLLQPLSNSSRNLPTEGLEKHSPSRTKRRVPANPLRRPPPGTSYTISERPPNRSEIIELEHELEDRIKSVLHSEEIDDRLQGISLSLQTHRDQTKIIRSRILTDLGLSIIGTDFGEIENEIASQEPWLRRRVDCECLEEVCNQVSLKLIDMLCVGSLEYGNVLRKLRSTYLQSFAEMKASWNVLREAYLSSNDEVQLLRDHLSLATSDLQKKEDILREQVDKEIQAISAEFAKEKAKDKELLAQTEQRMDQMSETLRSLNGIFKTMQQEGNATKMMDLLAKCQRLEKENQMMSNECLSADRLKEDNRQMKEKIQSLTLENRLKDEELSFLRSEVQRRDEVVANLIEKEALRNAEIERLQKIIEVREKEQEELELKESATSVLCIKCKKSLDDLTNIKAAAMSNGKSDSSVIQKLQCQSFRVLLPNLKGRTPHRSVSWLRIAMRCMLFAKLREDISLFAIHGQIARFPHFVYAWFDRSVSYMISTSSNSSSSSSNHGVVINSSTVSRALMMSDEDRWGLYYGVKTLARENDPEAMIFWALLDEKFGQDGLQFVLHCLSIVLSLGGLELWNQFGHSVVDHCQSITCRPEIEDPIRRYIYIPLSVAKEATQLILTRALDSHLLEALETLDAFTILPVVEMEQEKGPDEEDDDSYRTSPSKDTSKTSIKNKKPTHLSLFMWLRLMLQQIHAEQIQRGAALRLMFETASVGALTPSCPLPSDKENAESIHVEFPQFHSICKTLFPKMSVADSAALYSRCYEDGKKRVNAVIFQKIADDFGIFSRFMRLNTFPIFEKQIEVLKESQESYSLSGFHGEQGLRVQLGSLVHRKLASVTPDLHRLIENLPEKWRSLILDAMENVIFSLNDSYAKMKKKLGESSAANAAAASASSSSNSRHFIDGLQPYVNYRRLLSLTLFVASLTDNPILPSDVFFSRNPTQQQDPFEIGLQQAEKLLSNMEESLVQISRGMGKSTLSKYVRFENVRRNLVVRKLQSVVLKYLQSDSIIPRSVRLLLRPGYLSRRETRFRNVIRDPYWAQVFINEIYSFHYQQLHHWFSCGGVSDSQGRKLSLGQSMVTYFYSCVGVMEVVERCIHDLLSLVRSYRHGLPRLRLFSLFLGEKDNEIDESLGAILAHPSAWTTYMDLILSIHCAQRDSDLRTARIAQEREKEEKMAQKQAATSTTTTTTTTSIPKTGVLNSSDEDQVDQQEHEQQDAEMMTQIEEDSGNATAAMEVEVHNPEIHVSSTPTSTQDSSLASASLPSKQQFSMLFPCVGETLPRSDRRSVWTVFVPTVHDAVRRWSSRRMGIESNPSLFSDFIHKLKVNLQGEVDVDELSWVLMLQWAKVIHFYQKRASTRVAWNDQHSPIRAFQSHPNHMDLALSAEYITDLAMSIYKPGEGATICHKNYWMTEYLQHMSERNILYYSSMSVDDKGSLSIEQLMKNGILWDFSASSNFCFSSSNLEFMLSSSPILIFSIIVELYHRYQEPISSFLKDVQSYFKQDANIDSAILSIQKQMMLVQQLISDSIPRDSPSKCVKVLDLCWSSVRKLLSSVEDLRFLVHKLKPNKESVFSEFPRDSWSSDAVVVRKFNFDKCSAYNIVTKNNII